MRRSDVLLEIEGPCLQRRYKTQWGADDDV